MDRARLIGFAVGEADEVSRPIHIRPFGRDNFARAGAGEQTEPQASRRVGADLAPTLGLYDRLRGLRNLQLAQEALAKIFTVELDPLGRVRCRWPKPKVFSIAHHRPDRRNGAVGPNRDRLHLVVEAQHVLT